MPFPKPSDVPDYVPKTVTYTAPFVRGDGSNSWGGTAPGLAAQLTDPNPTVDNAWLDIGTYGESTGYKDTGAGEGKFRMIVNTSHISRDDPIRNYGLPDTAHWHQFFGNRLANAHSTYRTLRMNPGSNSSGGILNGTAYWSPLFIKTIGGKQYGKKMDQSVIYYNSDIIEARAHKLSAIPRGLRYIAGTNMDDPLQTAYKAEVDAANAAFGTPGRITYPGNGIVGYAIYDKVSQTLYAVTNGQDAPAGGQRSYVLKNLDGSDPWGGAVPTDGSAEVVMLIEAPEWWDGTNLWSPGGYNHLRYPVVDTVAGVQRGPDGWWQLPKLQIAHHWTCYGFADYGTWRLASDDHLAMVLGTAVANGKSFHTDWLGAWNGTIMTTWMRNGMGIDGFTPHEMNDSIISATQKLLTSNPAPDGSRNPQVTRETWGSNASDMVLLPTGAASGPITIGHRGV